MANNTSVNSDQGQMKGHDSNIDVNDSFGSDFAPEHLCFEDNYNDSKELYNNTMN